MPSFFNVKRGGVESNVTMKEVNISYFSEVPKIGLRSSLTKRKRSPKCECNNLRGQVLD